MSKRVEYFCDKCGEKLTRFNESFAKLSVNIGWPKSNFHVTLTVGELCKTCAGKYSKDNFKGKLLEEVLKAIEKGQPVPLP